MTYGKALEALARVPHELRKQVADAIRDYAITREKVNSRSAAAKFLKTAGQPWNDAAKEYARQAMGILIKQVLVDDLCWEDEAIRDAKEDRSYHIYWNPDV